LVEQFAKMALSLADEAAVMANGRIVRTGPPGDMEDELVESYLGDSRATRARPARPPKPAPDAPVIRPVEKGADPAASHQTTAEATTGNGITGPASSLPSSTEPPTESRSEPRIESRGVRNGRHSGAQAMESSLWLKPFDDGSDLSWPRG